MLVTYPALFYYDDTDGANAPYFVTFPDFEHSATQGEDMADAMAMASDWLGINLADYIENGREIPTPTPINALSLASNNPFQDDEDIDLVYDPSKSFISMVMVDVAEYLGSQEPVKKNPNHSTLGGYIRA